MGSTIRQKKWFAAAVVSSNFRSTRREKLFNRNFSIFVGQDLSQQPWDLVLAHGSTSSSQILCGDFVIFIDQVQQLQQSVFVFGSTSGWETLWKFFDLQSSSPVDQDLSWTY